MNIEALLIASGQNIKRLLTYRGHRPKKLAQAAALRPPAATSHEISRARKAPREALSVVNEGIFQQCLMALAGPPRSHENGSVALS